MMQQSLQQSLFVLLAVILASFVEGFWFSSKPRFANRRRCGFCMYDYVAWAAFKNKDYEGILVPVPPRPQCRDPQQYYINCTVGCFRVVESAGYDPVSASLDRSRHEAKGCNDQIFNTPFLYNYRNYTDNSGPEVGIGRRSGRNYTFEFCASEECYTSVHAKNYNQKEEHRQYYAKLSTPEPFNATAEVLNSTADADTSFPESFNTTAKAFNATEESFNLNAEAFNSTSDANNSTLAP